jgi:hypothetical protein
MGQVGTGRVVGRKESDFYYHMKNRKYDVAWLFISNHSDPSLMLDFRTRSIFVLSRLLHNKYTYEKYLVVIMRYVSEEQAKWVLLPSFSDLTQETD